MKTEGINNIVKSKAEELSIKHNCKVNPFIFKTEDGDIIGYLKEPERLLKLRVIDMLNMGQHTASGDAILQACLIKEESDPRILSESPNDDMVYIGAVMHAQELVKYYTNQFKKK